MAYKLQVGEILAKLSEFKGKGSVEKKIAWLIQNDSATLRLVLDHAFNPKVVYQLPEGDPPYKKDNGPIGLSDTSLWSETRKLKYLWCSPPAGVKKRRLEELFINMLEGLHDDDAKIVLAMKSKTLHMLYPGLTDTLVKKAFPNLLP